ncbi:hypothetical protein ML096_004294 [Klebsiella variicola]|nr:hypothetical protein [Klebsiella variicola]
MAITELNFSDDFDLYVDVYIDDIFTTKGQLTFKFNHAPCLCIEDNDLYYSLRNREEKTSKAQTKIKCIHKGDIYLLYTNKILYNLIYPKYIIKSKDEFSYTKLYISIPGIYQFFMGSRGFIFTDGELKKKIENSFLNIEFINEKKKYILTITHDFSISTSKNETNIHEDAILCIECLTDVITFDDVKNLSFKLKTFFSIVFGTSLSIKYTSLGNHDGNVYSPFYFFNHYFDSESINYSTDTLVTHPSYIATQDWQVMINNFFSEINTIEFKEIWTRFVSLYSYQGYWEFKVLGYASILDVYSQKLVDERKEIKIPKKKMRLLKMELISSLTEKAQLLGINEPEYHQIINSFCSHINGFRNTLTPTFKERYLHALKIIDPHFISVINFTEKDFSIIKEIRDSAAHGKPVKINNGEHKGNFNINETLTLVNKLVILLSCLAFKKLGIDEKRFAKMIVHSHNKIKINADLNELKLDVYSENAKVINVDAETFLRSKKLFTFDFSILEDKSLDNYKFNDSLLLNLMREFKTKRNGMFSGEDFCQYIYENYNPNAYFCVELIQKVYLVYEEEKNCLHNVLWVRFKIMTDRIPYTPF